MKKKHAILPRTYFDTHTEGVMSWYEDNKSVGSCCMIEKPWLNNKNGVSCIPEGTYDAVPIKSHSKNSRLGYKVFILIGQTCGSVNGDFERKKRNNIYIHTFNSESESLGCQGPGESFRGSGVGRRTVNSTKAMRRLLDWAYDSGGFTLEIL